MRLYRTRFDHLGLIALVAVLTGGSVTAQELRQWRPTSSGDHCAIITNTQLQPKLPSAGIGLEAAEKKTVTLLIRDYLSETTPPKTGEIVFASRTAPVNGAIGFGEQSGGAYGIAVPVSVRYLKDFAESPSFRVRFDGKDFATYSLAERGQAVAYMAECMQQMPR